METTDVDRRRINVRTAGEEVELTCAASPPPKSLLLFLVRMGSFTSSPKIGNNDSQDDDVLEGLGAEDATTETLVALCRLRLKDFPPLLRRSFRPLRSRDNEDDASSFRIMQWNVLSQALGECNDNFTACPKQALEWNFRRFRMLEEILVHGADIVCLQEVDHYNFLKSTLGPVGFEGTFFPKPDSPCIYLKGNNGPDGCAIFFRGAKFELVRSETRILEVWHTVQSNQVVVMLVLRLTGTDREICVVTTHLKAKQGSFLAKLRDEQGKDLLDFVRTRSGGRPVVLCGDFNAEPSEPVYSTVLNFAGLGLASSYFLLDGQREPPFTTWKIREDGEVCHTIDYIFYSEDDFRVDRLLEFPDEKEMDASRVPSFRYSSDHFSLVADLSLTKAVR